MMVILTNFIDVINVVATVFILYINVLDSFACISCIYNENKN